MHRRVLRWEIPVDDAPHLIGTGAVLHTAMRAARVAGRDRSVEVWTVEWLPDEFPEGPDIDKRWVQVFGTGHRLPDFVAQDVGSTVDVDDRLVWHVFEVER